VVVALQLMMLYPVSAPPSFAFHVVEVMSSPKYHLKEVGYLAAESAFPEGTEEVVLTVNGLKKVRPTLELGPVAAASGSSC
jgi:AP-3 complex subunit delta-1